MAIDDTELTLAYPIGGKEHFTVPEIATFGSAAGERDLTSRWNTTMQSRTICPDLNLRSLQATRFGVV